MKKGFNFTFPADHTDNQSHGFGWFLGQLIGYLLVGLGTVALVLWLLTIIDSLIGALV